MARCEIAPCATVPGVSAQRDVLAGRPYVDCGYLSSAACRG